MIRRPFIRLRTGALAVAIATAAIFAEAARTGNIAEAAQWKLYVTPTEAYCEGCCSGNFLCCTLEPACSHPYPAEPQGGG